MTIKPHPTFATIRADEVAECWEGVGTALYAKLWNEIVPLQKSIPNIEDSGPHDHVGFENLAAHWHLLTPGEQEHYAYLILQQCQKRLRTYSRISFYFLLTSE